MIDPAKADDIHLLSSKFGALSGLMMGTGTNLGFSKAAQQEDKNRSNDIICRHLNKNIRK
jgi:hypothetical protein